MQKKKLEIPKNLKKLKVFGYAWHVGHQYELSKLFGEYHFLINPYRTWGEKSRPFPDNAKWVSHFDPKENYDLALLHVDQTSISEGTKNQLFVDVEKVTRGKVPRAIINHMVPIHDDFETPEVIKRMKELVGDIPMVVNSRQAGEMWGFGTPIIHGLDPNDFYSDLPKEPRVIIVLSPAGMDRAYNRTLAYKTIDILKEKGIQTYWVGSNIPTFKNYDEYRDFIGRSAVFFFPASDSPMPRARTEAMMSGCCIVTTPYHDADRYIKHGENGYLVRNYLSASDTIYDLLVNNYKKAVEVGKKGRETAIKELHTNRWAKDWEQFLIKNGVIK